MAHPTGVVIIGEENKARRRVGIFDSTLDIAGTRRCSDAGYVDFRHKEAESLNYRFVGVVVGAYYLSGSGRFSGISAFWPRLRCQLSRHYAAYDVCRQTMDLRIGEFDREPPLDKGRGCASSRYEGALNEPCISEKSPMLIHVNPSDLS